MFVISYRRILVSIFLLCILSISTSACSPSSEISPQPTETQVASAGENQTDSEAILICPLTPTRYAITYFHYQHLLVDPGTGEIIDITWQNSFDPGVIQVWIDENGEITAYEDNDPITVVVDGKAIYPNSDNCSEQKLSGAWELDSTLTGECKDGKVKIEIEHFYTESDLESSCGQIPPIVDAIISGPEQTLNFDLVDSLPSMIVEIGEGTFLHVRYAYYFTNDETFLEIEPLVPEND